MHDYVGGSEGWVIGAEIFGLDIDSCNGKY
jgi:hypothetical protein